MTHSLSASERLKRGRRGEPAQLPSIQTIGGVSRDLRTSTMFFASILPEEALYILERNIKNRALSKSAVSDIVRDLKAGAWRVNGDAIRFSEDGVLIDGQHRIAACIEADTWLDTYVVTGLPAAAQETIDRGRRRTIANVFEIEGRANARSVATITRELVGIVTGEFGAARLSVAEAKRVLGSVPEIDLVATAYSNAPGPRSALAALEAMARADEDYETANAWRNVWTRGIPWFADCPAHLLRERIIREKDKTATLSSTPLRKLVVKSFLAFKARRPLKIIKLLETENVRVTGWSASRIGVPNIRLRG